MQKEANVKRIEEYASKFQRGRPEVLEVTPEEALDLKQDIEQKVVFVDVRSPPEQEVSTISGAVTKEEFTKNIEGYRQHKVVCFCTIGLRSGLFAQRLCAQDIDAVNMRGSLLSWVHAGLPLVNPTSGSETKRLHVCVPSM